MRIALVLLAVCVILLSVNSASAQDGSMEEESATRIKRPQPVPDYFLSTAPGLSNRWWRKFRNPSFCPYVLCGSSCSDISGVPRVGSYTADELLSGTTPCSINGQHSYDSESGGCCMSRTVDTEFHKSCVSPGACCDK